MGREPIHRAACERDLASCGQRAPRPRLLIINDDRSMCELLERGLQKRGFDVSSCTEPLAVLPFIPGEPVDALIIDQDLRTISGTALCQHMLAAHPELPLVVLATLGGQEPALAVVRAGAYDFLTKPIEVDALALVLTRAVQHRALCEQAKTLRRAVTSFHLGDELIGSSPAMQRLRERLDRVAGSEGSVLITGEHGTGKEHVARTLHQQSVRRTKPFITLPCARLPEALLEEELFGCARSTHSDARTARKGLFQQAAGGTLLLNEISELPSGLQSKLLRVLEERQVRPVGGSDAAAVDVRVMASTSRDLAALVAEHGFSEELYVHINVARLDLPPLRARDSDVLLMAQHILERFALRLARPVVSLSARAAERLLGYAWPGNVRELKLCMLRAVALASQAQIGVDDLPEPLRDSRPAAGHFPLPQVSELVPLEELKHRYTLHVLDALKGNQELAAQTLGVDRRALGQPLERPIENP